ncbi:NAD(P)-dependent oxidoreductase [Pseudonocardia lutea]|uniref:NAD(P)-dependent oxidoreductase n=1 Tax=Pseudonocardia lutea TaxID=2172015 RepID=A0ABW1I2I5_9PSEU
MRSTIGFVGLGRMGRPMAARLAEAGWAVRGFDAGTVEPPAGVTLVGSAAETAAGADVVVLMLPSSDIVEAVLDGGLLTALAPGSLLLDMGSSRPLSSRVIAEQVAAQGAAFVDAPVSGGVRGAIHGELTIMAGGAEEDLDRVRPLLDILGRSVVHAGGVGAGHAAKALNNLLSASHLLATSEAVLAGKRFGLDPAVLLQAINGSSGRSGSSEVKWPKFVLPGTYDSGFALALMLKDMKIATELAEAQDSPIAFGRAAVDAWERAAKELPTDADHTEIARWVDANGELR